MKVLRCVFIHVLSTLEDASDKPPPGLYNIEVSDEIASDLIDGIGDPRDHRPLSEWKDEAIARVNKSAGICRAKFITVIPGQDATYQLKGAEADAANAILAGNGSPVPADYPILNAEALATGASFLDTLTLVTQTASQWKQLAAVVEGARRGAIVAIQNATTWQEVEAVNPTFP